MRKPVIWCGERACPPAIEPVVGANPAANLATTTNPSGIRRCRARLCGLRRWPTLPATGRGAYRPRRRLRARRTCSSRRSATLPRASSATPSSSSRPLRTGPVKPMASRTRSTSSSNSVPGMASNFGGGPTRTPCSFFTLPCSSPVKRTVETLQSRRPPSSCELSTRNCMGQSGQGVCGRARRPAASAAVRTA